MCNIDQRLWLKAVEILRAKSHVVCRLGGFRTLMSFEGSIGGSIYDERVRLEEALGTVYEQNAVTHMISGRTVSRVLCGHFLVQAALFNKLMSAVLPLH